MNPPIIKLPVNGATLIQYLQQVNDYETAKAGDYIKTEMSPLLKATIHSWFKVSPPELDRSLTKKISNSVLAAGNAGFERTVEALSQLRFKETLSTAPNTPRIAAEELREIVRPYREAKNWIANKSKCVNSVLKTPQLVLPNNPELLNLSAYVVTNSKDFQDWNQWQSDLFDLWSKSTKVAERLRGSYQNHWQFFQGTFDQSMMNGQYRLILTQQVDQLIHGLDAYIEQADQAYEEMMLSPKRIIDTYELQVQAEGSEVIFILVLNERFDTPGRLNSIKADIGYQLSNLIERASSHLAISEIPSDFPTLCLRMKKPARKSDFDAISASVSDFCENLG